VCFSATASFTSAAVLGVGGAATLASVRRGRDVPLALLGIGFAGHQLAEGVIWRQLAVSGSVRLPSPALGLWVLYSWILLPVWVPVALALVEPARGRRHAMAGLAGAGAAVGGAIVVLALRGSVVASARSGHISYILTTSPGLWIGVPYVLVTCIPPLLSSHGFLRLWGLALVVSMGLTAVLATRQFESVWCFCAALLTLMLLGWFVARRRGPRPPGAAPSPDRVPVGAGAPTS
jgi:hypothetical protein